MAKEARPSAPGTPPLSRVSLSRHSEEKARNAGEERAEWFWGRERTGQRVGPVSPSDEGGQERRRPRDQVARAIRPTRSIFRPRPDLPRSAALVLLPLPDRRSEIAFYPLAESEASLF